MDRRDSDLPTEWPPEGRLRLWGNDALIYLEHPDGVLVIDRATARRLAWALAEAARAERAGSVSV